ncbi:hypothetical protein [Oricola indica]|uniref:hypothetical protein n=1 Tax=Oricola indica TaxID=2872591 RepID=UPI003CCC2600
METVKKFVQTTSDFSSEVKRFAIVTDIDRFEAEYPTGWKEVDPDFHEERAIDGFDVLLSEARKNGFAVIQR